MHEHGCLACQVRRLAASYLPNSCPQMWHLLEIEISMVTARGSSMSPRPQHSHHY